jgi:hypothetical protein
VDTAIREAVIIGTEGDEISQGVIAAVGDREDVVHVDHSGKAADDARIVIALPRYL